MIAKSIDFHNPQRTYSVSSIGDTQSSGYHGVRRTRNLIQRRLLERLRVEEEHTMEIVLGSLAGVTCVFYAYVFVKFARERITNEALKRRLPTVILPLC